MSMSINILAILVSLAVMITGGAGVPGDVQARTLTVSNVSLTLNGETVRLNPAARVGVQTDGETALFDFAVENGGEDLLPVQASVNEEGLTLIAPKDGTAFTVTAGAFEKLIEQSLEGEAVITPESENMITFIRDEYLPAYMGLFEMIQDPARLAEINEKVKVVYGETVDRGAGTPDVVSVQGEEMELTRYQYTLKAADLGRLADAIYTCDDTLKAYYDALFKLYDMAPEESGLNGLTSFEQIMTGSLMPESMDMTMDITEWLSDDGVYQVQDATLTFVIPQELAEEIEEDGDAEEPEPLPPVVMYSHAETVGMNGTSTFSCDYTYEDVAFSFSGEGVKSDDVSSLNMTLSAQDDADDAANFRLEAHSDGAEKQLTVAAEVLDGEDEKFNMDLQCSDNGTEKRLHFALEGGDDFNDSVRASFDAAADAGGATVEGELMQYDPHTEAVSFEAHLHYGSDLAEDGSGVATLDVSADSGAEFSFNGSVTKTTLADGSAHGEVTLAFGVQDLAAVLSFNVDKGVKPFAAAEITGEPFVIDDLSDEGIEALTGDNHVLAAAMGLMATYSDDVQKLTNEESVQQLIQLVTNLYAPTYEETDYAVDYDDGYTYEPEDDGEMPFEVPEFTWLPEGWSVITVNEDTAYDYADMQVNDDEDALVMYASFMPDDAYTAAEYIVDEDGALQPVEGRKVSIDNNDGIWNVTTSEHGVYASIVIFDDKTDMETVGRILAGMQY